MLGSIIADLFRTHFYSDNDDRRTPLSDDPAISGNCIMILAIDNAVMVSAKNKTELSTEVIAAVQSFGERYSLCRYPESVEGRLKNPHLPCKAADNRFAVLAGVCGLIAENIEEAKKSAKQMLEPLCSRSEIIEEAETFAAAVCMAKNGATKIEITQYIKTIYYMPDDEQKYLPDEQGSGFVPALPYALQVFLSSDSFSETLYNTAYTEIHEEAVYAFAGGLAEAYYGIPKIIEKRLTQFLDNELYAVYKEYKHYIHTIFKPEKHRIITKYISKLTDDDHLHNFIDEFYIFAKEHPECSLEKYDAVLKSKGILWTEESMLRADIEELDADIILACIMGALRAEHFSSGMIDVFNKNGALKRWLVRLKNIDAETPVNFDMPDIVNATLKIQSSFSKESFMLTAHGLSFKIYSPSFGTLSYTYTFGKISGRDKGQLLFEKLQKALECRAWQDTKEIWEEAVRYKLNITYEDGSVIEHFGLYDRAHVPEKEWLEVMHDIATCFSAFTAAQTCNTERFMDAMKTGEVKYCGVEFTEDGRIYHYRTEDAGIAVGDTVVVPVGYDNYERTAVVKTIQFYRWDDDTPYPLEKTKEIIRKLDNLKLT